MNFSFPLLLLSLSFRFILCENCSEALHETFKRDFDIAQKCDECVILSSESLYEEQNWTGFCSENKFFFFPEWKCKTKKELLNITGFIAIVSIESCYLDERNHDLDEKCLMMFNLNICNRRLGSVGGKNQDKGDKGDGKTDFFHFLATQLEYEVRDVEGNTASLPEKHAKGTSTTKKTICTSTTETANTEETSTETSMTKKTTTEGRTTQQTSTETTTTNEETTETFIQETTQTNPIDTSTDSVSTRETSSTTNTISTQDTSSTEHERTTFSEVSNPSQTDYLSTTKSNLLVKKTCESGELLYKNHCYFLKAYDVKQNVVAHEEEAKERNILISSVNSIGSCQSRHPKALGLAVETKEENEFILNFLRARCRNSIIFTSGVRVEGLPDEWSGWNLKVNPRVLNFKNLSSGTDMFYCIDACSSQWYLIKQNETLSVDTNFNIICERPYNPKNVQLDLHEQCLRLYRNSSCYNFEKHTNYCCEKDETGEIWFSCPGNASKTYSQNVICTWTCKSEGVFVQDRPICSGIHVCKESYNDIEYIGPVTRYAISDCPPYQFGRSTWYCTWNTTFLGKPDYSLCCESGTRHCRQTDVFLNIWMGCPSKKIEKKTACPSGSALDEAWVEWYCLDNGTFLGDTPDYSNCNISKIACKRTDSYDREWKAEAGTTATKNCPLHFTGKCSWKCKTSGNFDGAQPDCSRCKADWMDEIADKIKNQTNHEAVMEIMENYTTKEDIRIGYGHVLNLTSECVILFKNQTSPCKFNVFDKFLKSYNKILKNMVGNPNTWSCFSESNRRAYTEKIISVTQSAAFAHLESVNGTQYNQTFAQSSQDGFDFFVAYNPSNESRFPLENFSQSDWNLHIKQVKETGPSYAVMGLAMNHSLTSLMFPQGNETQGLEINAPAITFTVAVIDNGEVLMDPNVVVSVSFKHTNRTRLPGTVVIQRRLHKGEQPSGVFNSTLCFYYSDSDWSTEGCSVTFTSKDRTNCTCNHLSTIGLLMTVHKYEPNETLEIVSIISSAFTIVSLILALLVFFFFDNAGNDRVLIGKNLCFCLLVGHSLLITVLDKKFFNISDKICAFNAAILHYVFMAAFAWMFVEGYHLYRMLVLVFDSGIEYRLIYLLIGYGTPLVVVGATHVVGFIFKEQPYGQDELCWLKPPNYVWAFVGPVILLTSINFCIMVIAMKLAMQSQRRTEKSNFSTIMLWKGWMSLSVLLGITWLFGVAYISYYEPLVYAFVFFNGLQGFFIFLFRCVLCEQYRAIFLKKLKCWFSKSQSKSHKKIENVKSDTKLYAISATKSVTDTKDSGYEPGIATLEDLPRILKKTDKYSKTRSKSGESSSSGIEVGITLTPAVSEAYLRNRMIARNFSARKSKAKWLTESDNFPELSFHDSCHPK